MGADTRKLGSLSYYCYPLKSLEQTRAHPNGKNQKWASVYANGIGYPSDASWVVSKTIRTIRGVPLSMLMGEDAVRGESNHQGWFLKILPKRPTNPWGER